MVTKKWNHFRLDEGDVVISTSASLGKTAIVDKETMGAILYTGLIRFKPSDVILREYLYLLFSSQYYLDQINVQKTGAIIKHYGPTHLRKIVFPLPPINIQKKIVEQINYVNTARADLVIHLADSIKIFKDLINMFGGAN